MAQDHRRRIEFEDKAKVVGLGDRILAALAVIWNKRLNSAVCFKKTEAKQLAQKGGLFQKDQGKTAGAVRILFPNSTRRPLLCLLIQSFFYAQDECNLIWVLELKKTTARDDQKWLISATLLEKLQSSDFLKKIHFLLLAKFRAPNNREYFFFKTTHTSSRELQAVMCFRPKTMCSYRVQAQKYFEFQKFYRPLKI